MKFEVGDSDCDGDGKTELCDTEYIEHYYKVVK